jgi:hypothetical protein
MKLGLHLPINSVSFGQTATLLLRCLYEREKASQTDIDWHLFPIGNTDLSSQKVEQEFANWINSKIVKAYESFSRDIPTFKLWHLNGSMESVSNRQTLLSFYELDKPTKIELNIARNSNILFTSKYTCDVFKLFGVEAKYLPLAFDSYNFSVLDKKFHVDDRIVFNLCGKFEKRKHTEKIIKAWIKKYGGQRNFVLQAAVYNPFLIQQTPQGPVDLNNQFLGRAVNGNKPYNVTFYPFMKENVVYNEFLNSGNIIIGMSGGEGWGLPEFHSIALGKHAVLLNAHSYKSWATPEVATFVNPSQLIEATDDIHFRKGEPFNQGNIFDWNEDEFIAACETAVNKVKANRVNTAGLKLQQEYTKDKFADAVIGLLKS